VPYNPILFQNQYRNPNPLYWKETRTTLPQAAASSQLAVIDEYYYLFGGKEFATIYSAPIGDPTVWTNVGSLPTPIYSSQLSIIDGVIYLFGGNADGYTSKHIWSASTSSPTVWTDNGALLPSIIQDHQIFLTPSYIFLVGGRDEVDLSSGFSTVKNTIYYAPLSNPLSWSILPATLPQPICCSQVACIGSNVYLFGGVSSNGAQTANIVSANIYNLSYWNVVNQLPYPIANGSFFTYGDGYGYIVSPGEVPYSPNAVGTRILKCSLSFPTQWADTGMTVPGNVSESSVLFTIENNIANVYLLGGNGNSAIYKTDFGYNVKTTSDNVSNNILNWQNNIGFPLWKIFGNY
jgi:hypothetical protein